MFGTCRLVLHELPRMMHRSLTSGGRSNQNTRTMSYCFGSSGALRLAALVAACGLVSLGCEDESPSVSADGSGGSAGAGAESGSLDATSPGGTAGTGGSVGAGNVGGNGGVGAGGSDGDRKSVV